MRRGCVFGVIGGRFQAGWICRWTWSRLLLLTPQTRCHRPLSCQARLYINCVRTRRCRTCKGPPNLPSHSLIGPHSSLAFCRCVSIFMLLTSCRIHHAAYCLMHWPWHACHSITAFHHVHQLLWISHPMYIMLKQPPWLLIAISIKCHPLNTSPSTTTFNFQLYAYYCPTSSTQLACCTQSHLLLPSLYTICWWIQSHITSTSCWVSDAVQEFDPLQRIVYLACQLISASR